MTAVPAPPATVPEHPAKFSPAVLDALEEIVADEALRLGRLVRVLDPFAGVGRIHLLSGQTVGVELEPDWAIADPRTLVGDALHLPFPDEAFDVVATSPCYGNRLADQHDARDVCKACNGEGTLERLATPEEVDAGCELGIAFDRCKSCKGEGLARRNTYRHRLGRPLSPGSSAGMQWGKTYREFHGAAWREAIRVLRRPRVVGPKQPLEPGGLLVVNVSNFLQTGEKGGPQLERPVVEWHLNALISLGVTIVDVARVSTRRHGFGANRDARVVGETVIACRPGMAAW